MGLRDFISPSEDVTEADSVPLAQLPTFDTSTPEGKQALNQSLKKRKGGLQPDSPHTKTYIEQIQSGLLPPEQADIIANRNPSIASLINSAKTLYGLRIGSSEAGKNVQGGGFDPSLSMKYLNESGQPEMANSMYGNQVPNPINPKDPRLATDNTPSSVREYEYYKKLSPEDQKTFLKVRRAEMRAQFADQGDQIQPLNPVTGQPLAAPPIPVNLPPEKKPVNIEAAAAAGVKGTEGAKADIQEENAQPDNLEIIDITDNLLKNPNTKSYFGGLQGAIPTLKEETMDVQADIERLTGMLSLEGRKKLVGQGQISDFEGRTLAKSMTILTNPRISDKRAMVEIERINKVIKNAKSRYDAKKNAGEWKIEEVK